MVTMVWAVCVPAFVTGSELMQGLNVGAKKQA